MVHKFDDFKLGDKVYHLSNTEFIMVINKIEKETNKLSCSWINNKGIRDGGMFIPEELGLESEIDTGFGIAGI